MKRLTRDEVRSQVWAAVTFLPKPDKRALEKMGVFDAGHSQSRQMIDAVCDAVDNDRYGMVEHKPDEYVRAKSDCSGVI